MDAKEESFRKADSGSIQHGDCLGIENIQTREKQAEEQVAKGNWGTANPGTSSPDHGRNDAAVLLKPLLPGP